MDTSISPEHELVRVVVGAVDVGLAATGLLAVDGPVYVEELVSDVPARGLGLVLVTSRRPDPLSCTYFPDDTSVLIVVLIAAVVVRGTPEPFVGARRGGCDQKKRATR